MSPSPRMCLIVVIVLGLSRPVPGADDAGLAPLAADTLLAVQQRYEAGEPSTPLYTDLMYAWTRRTGAAAIQAESESEGRIYAARRNLRESEALYDLIRTIYMEEPGVIRVQQAVTEYALREAASWLARPDDVPADEEQLPEDLPPYDPRAGDLKECADRAAGAVRERVDAGEALTPTLVGLQATWLRRVAR